MRSKALELYRTVNKLDRLILEAIANYEFNFGSLAILTLDNSNEASDYFDKIYNSVSEYIINNIDCASNNNMEHLYNVKYIIDKIYNDYKDNYWLPRYTENNKG